MNFPRPSTRVFGLAVVLLTGPACVGQVNENDATEAQSASTETRTPTGTPSLPPAPVPNTTYYGAEGGQGGQGGTVSPPPAPTPAPVAAPAPAPAQVVCVPNTPDGGAPAPAPAPAPTPTPTPTPAPAPAPAPTPAPDGGVPVATPLCATAAEIAAKILTPKCGSCHGKSSPAAGLDLVTAGVKARLLNVAARGCGGKILIVTNPKVGGHFFDKLYGSVAGCGSQMPFGAPPLSAVEIKCLADWIVPTP